MVAANTEATIWRLVGAGVTGACWIWTGTVGRGGYGVVRLRGTVLSVHRWVYEQLVGPIPSGLVIDHLCRVRICCNPDHLEPVTHGENIRRGALSYGLRTHCRNGHNTRAPESTFIGSDGRQRCLKCHRNDARRTEARRKEANPDASRRCRVGNHKACKGGRRVHGANQPCECPCHPARKD